MRRVVSNDLPVRPSAEQQANAQIRTEQRKTDVDLTIIGACSLVSVGVYMAFNSQLVTFARDSGVNLLLRVLVMALFQFGVAGLGISIVSIIRKESFVTHGLRLANLPKAVILSVLATVPYLIYIFATGTQTTYLPFQTVWHMEEVLASGFPSNVLGVVITAVAWGFFEGFNYAFICDKINARYPVRSTWLNWGAIACGVMCLLIHGLVGVTPDALAEALSVFILIYGMLVAKTHTGNAWGTVFLFVFVWNAL